MANTKKYNDTLKKINQFGVRLGVEKEKQVIMELQPTQKKNEKILKLKSKSFEGPKPWFIIDEEGEIRVLVHISNLENLLESERKNQIDNFELRLEKALYRQVPVDFNDVWVVAMELIKRKCGKWFWDTDLDLDKLMEDLKKEHPNLFIDMDAVVQRIEGK